MGKEKMKNNLKDNEMNNEEDRRTAIHTAIISLAGAIVGALISLCGTWHTTQIQLDIVEKQYQQELEVIEKEYQQEIEILTREKTEEIYIDMLQSIYGLRKINEGLVDENILGFREECYTIMAKARIFCNVDTVELYDTFLKDFFENHIYNGKYVDDKLIPAIRKELDVDN